MEELYRADGDFTKEFLQSQIGFSANDERLSGYSFMMRASLFSLCIVLSSFLRTAALADPVDFEKQVRPILEEHCFDCHGEETQKHHLRMDNTVGILRGGESGEPFMLPGKSTESHLIARVTSQNPKERMPPKGERLTSEQVATLRRWIDEGAKMPDMEAAAASLQLKTDHWSFQPVKRPTVPKSKNAFARGEIDEFVLAKLQEKRLSPSPIADKTTLIRRLYLVAHGLPPTPREVAEFLADTKPDAYARLVDRVLASPRFGERFARHWMDVVRYADSNGFETNRERKTAFHYRDWIVASFNADKPYDRFIKEQLAGDQLGVDSATGFLVAGPYDIVKSPDVNLTLAQRQDELADMVNTTGTAFLGLTLGCARCHNHKFDPILQKDYYSMQAVFDGVGYGDRPLREKINEDSQRKLTIALTAPQMGWVGTFGQPGKTHRLYRGDPLQKREVVSPDALSVLGTLGLSVETPESLRRLKFAEWIASPQNPLTARVMVNRLWHYSFGTGIVDTPSDFGKNGTPPTHPELLDWLADEFVHSGWSIKHIERLILLSSTFQQSSSSRAEAIATDAGGRFLWRYTPRRLEAEAIRDSMLAVSGALDLKMGGPGFYLMDVVEENVMHYFPKEQFSPAEFRRMVYQFRIRQTTDSVFSSFDCPDGGSVMPKRSRSNTPLQALNLFNSTFVIQQADILAKRLVTECGDEPESQVALAFHLFYGRPPDPAELRASTAMIRAHGLSSFSRAMFNTSEFLFVF